jgi:hypothetical protein
MNDHNYQPRYRNRLKLERTFKVGRLNGRHLVLESYYLKTARHGDLSAPCQCDMGGAAILLALSKPATMYSYPLSSPREQLLTVRDRRIVDLKSINTQSRFLAINHAKWK